VGRTTDVAGGDAGRLVTFTGWRTFTCGGTAGTGDGIAGAGGGGGGGGMVAGCGRRFPAGGDTRPGIRVDAGRAAVGAGRRERIPAARWLATGCTVAGATGRVRLTGTECV
jgi:hypothetical protein